MKVRWKKFLSLWLCAMLLHIQGVAVAAPLKSNATQDKRMLSSLFIMVDQKYKLLGEDIDKKLLREIDQVEHEVVLNRINKDIENLISDSNYISEFKKDLIADNLPGDRLNWDIHIEKDDYIVQKYSSPCLNLQKYVLNVDKIIKINLKVG